MGVVVEDGGEPPLTGYGPGEVGGHALDAIEVEHQLFQDVVLSLLLVDLAD